MSIQNNPAFGNAGASGAEEGFRSRSGGLDGIQRPVRGLNRSISLQEGLKNIPQGSEGGEGAKNTSLAQRSVSVTEGISLVAPPTHLLSKEEVVAEAGPTKRGSTNYTQILALTDQYHHSSGLRPADKLAKLDKLEAKIEKFFAGKAKQNKSLNAGQQKRLLGLSKQLAGIRAEKQNVIKDLITELRNPSLSKDAKSDLLEGLSPEILSKGVHGLEASERGAAVNTLAKELVEGGWPLGACQVVASAFENGDISLDTEAGRSAVNATLQTVDFEDIGHVVELYFSVGALDLQAVMDIGPELIRRMNMDGIIEDQTDADALMGSVDRSLFEGTAMGDALAKKAISGASMTGENQLDSLLQQQAYVIHTLVAVTDSPALKAMVMAWPGIGDKKTIDGYNAKLPDPSREIDIGKPRFAKEIQKMNAGFFEKLTSGEAFDPSDMGWNALHDGWQQEGYPASKDQVVHDYLARHAANLGVVY